MNILHHKSWHVRTKQNIARVRRDEERARKEEEEKLRRINVAEHEARINELRVKKSKNSTNHEAITTQPSTSFNLFENYKDKVSKDFEKEDEKKKDQEKWEVKAGIFSYLDGRYKYDKNDEWFLKSHEERMGLNSNLDDAKAIKDQKLKIQNDPLEDMKRYMGVMKRNEKSFEEEDKSKRGTSGSTHETYHKAKKKKTKHKKRRHQSSDSESEEDKSELIKRLRRERLEREGKERERTRLLLHGPSKVDKPADNRRSQKYNSQFNPHLARQNQSEL